ncbi:MAG: divergent polysaccharide deacetylase family protein [Alphaproteobacteria bacterium]
MSRYQDPKATALIILVGASLMILIHMVSQGEKKAERDTMHVNTSHEDSLYTHSEIADFELAAPASFKIQGEVFGPPERMGPPVPIFREMAGPFMPKVHKGPKDKIVIIIDDLGMDRRRTRAVMDLPACMTLAFLPYAPGLKEITGEAKAKGHELIIHVPMQPLAPGLDPGPLALRSDMSGDAFDLMLGKIFESFDGYVGINNHMGSKLTQDEAAMNRVMQALAVRNLIFVDSRTIGNSVGEKVAARYGLAHAGRDVFLDNQDNDASVIRALGLLESIARKRGVAIAIGHPKDSTIRALKTWLPGLAARGFEVVPVSAVAEKDSKVVKVIAPAR